MARRLVRECGPLFDGAVQRVREAAILRGTTQPFRDDGHGSLKVSRGRFGTFPALEKIDTASAQFSRRLTGQTRETRFQDGQCLAPVAFLGQPFGFENENPCLHALAIPIRQSERGLAKEG